MNKEFIESFNVMLGKETNKHRWNETKQRKEGKIGESVFCNISTYI
jgi:hypothetical protein